MFFPDAGSAALAKYEWGAGTETAQVRTSHRMDNVRRRIEKDGKQVLKIAAFLLGYV